MRMRGGCCGAAKCAWVPAAAASPAAAGAGPVAAGASPAARAAGMESSLLQPESPYVLCLQDFQSVGEQRLFQDLQTTQVGAGQSGRAGRAAVRSRVRRHAACSVLLPAEQQRGSLHMAAGARRADQRRIGSPLTSACAAALPCLSTRLQSVIRDQERLLTAVLASLRSSQQVGAGAWVG